MTELDFEELDKAVNDLMQDVDTSKRNPGLDDPEERTVKLGESETENTDTTPPEDGSVAIDQAPKTQPLAVKRRGRFMDVVHPSSDMRPPSGLTSHQATAVVPSKDFEAQPESNDNPVVAIQEDAGVTEVPKTDVMPEDVKPSDEAETEHDAPNDMPLSADVLSEVAAISEEKPQTSPFLANTKVEKRPLGGVAQPSEELLLSASTEGNDTDVIADDSTIDIEATHPEQFPNELHSDVMAIESAGSVHTENQTIDDKEDIQDETEQQPPATAIEQDKIPDSVQVGDNGSINQQYSEQPGSGDQTNGAIYDTDTYHKPLEHVPKKSGLTVLLWILVLMVIGAAAGAAYFYFTTR